MTTDWTEPAKNPRPALVEVLSAVRFSVGVLAILAGGALVWVERA
jgi:hypothetical protein